MDGLHCSAVAVLREDDFNALVSSRSYQRYTSCDGRFSIEKPHAWLVRDAHGGEESALEALGVFDTPLATYLRVLFSLLQGK